jgi:hypothetical protein
MAFLSPASQRSNGELRLTTVRWNDASALRSVAWPIASSG